ncbi:MAG: hypothetical protein QM750_04680 [Rubrivivax sp.]
MSPSNIPVWVFAVLALLIALGLRQARPRLMAPTLALGIGSLMVVFSLWGLWSAFGSAPAMLLCWALGLGATVAAGRRWLAPRGMVLADDARVLVPGSWLPLALMMGIFGLKFALGYGAATGHPVTAHSLAGAAVAALLGLFSGSFFARAQAVHRFARLAPAAAP